MSEKKPFGYTGGKPREPLTATSPGLGAYVVTPRDDADLPEPIRAVYVGGSGTLCFIDPQGEMNQTGTIRAGSLLPCFMVRLLATGTTATDLTGIE